MGEKFCATMNFVPPEIIKQHKNLKKKKILRKILVAVFVVLIIALGAETAFIAHNYINYEESQVQTSSSKDINQAQAVIAQVKKTQAVLNKAEEEYKPLIEIIDTLAAIKPTEVKITKMEFTESGTIQIEGYANDPSLCNFYVEQINGKKELFTSAHLEKLNSNTAFEQKTFLIKTSIAK